MNEIAQTLDAMDSTRLLLALLFMAGYTSSLGHLASERGRRWSIGLAALAGLAFVGLTNPWVHGALLIVFSVVGVGAFAGLAWAFSAWAMRAQPAAPAPVALEAVVQAEPSVRRVRRLRRRLAV